MTGGNGTIRTKDGAMHAMLITFQSSADLDSLAVPFAAYAQALRGVTGLVLTTWVQDGSALGGFHVFTSLRAAEAYLESDLLASLRANRTFTRFQIRRYAVLDALSHTTGTPLPSSA